MVEALRERHRWLQRAARPPEGSDPQLVLGNSRRADGTRLGGRADRPPEEPDEPHDELGATRYARWPTPTPRIPDQRSR